MLPAALTVVILVVILVGGGVWVVQNISSLKDNDREFANEFAKIQNELKQLRGK